MRRTFLASTAAVVALTAPASTASAQTVWTSVNGCGGATFISCATWSGSIQNGNQFVFTIANTSAGATAYNPGSVFTDVIFGNRPGSTAVTAFSFAGSESAWQQAGNGAINGFNGFSLGGNAFGATRCTGRGCNVGSGLDAGESTTFTFTFQSAITASNLTGLRIAVHDQGGFAPCGGSSKVVFDAATGLALQQTSCAGSYSSVPEPATAGMLAFGLTGLAGTGAARRLRLRRRR